ncbi:MAG: hypothetical protein ACR2NB_06390 [Solirubrobacteraceae bacterium]
MTLVAYVGAVPSQSQSRLRTAAKLVARDPELNELLGAAAYYNVPEGRAAYDEASGVIRAAEASRFDLLDLVTEIGRRGQLPSGGTR